MSSGSFPHRTVLFECGEGAVKNGDGCGELQFGNRLFALTFLFRLQPWAVVSLMNGAWKKCKVNDSLWLRNKRSCCAVGVLCFLF